MNPEYKIYRLHALRYGPGTIPDHNVEGYDSVDSQEFDPGFGCVPLEVPISEPIKNKGTCRPYTLGRRAVLTDEEARYFAEYAERERQQQQEQAEHDANTNDKR